MMDIRDAFKECTTLRESKGVFEISCDRGLWSVSGRSLADVTHEAMHYFMQYYRDGEYS